MPIAAGAADPRAACPAQPAESCGRDSLCDGFGACRFHAAGTVCAPASCSESLLTPPHTCDGKGACRVPPIALNCAPFMCDAAAVRCASYCTGNVDCALGRVCLNGNCVPTPPPS